MREKKRLVFNGNGKEGKSPAEGFGAGGAEKRNKV